ncbi:Fe(3+) ABC transporter substrate-binding protein [Pseudanabaena sp. FACHB-2040]|uniref:Fe(3+) ABC transporter substrate-binding protein n=1 Tax=Pseudanabaena sp. FACHB-2040 TaxID=2692859 RepID=UPI00168654F7|nr:Fe(3+) ABC transporter substrate-binding protein [Pseudanabaena sp. FACHB-2040]MBD2257373.1 Fe(3+) ABC transporter substrate-binding protein [Pseudanabaena sp. FACHB-2040]
MWNRRNFLALAASTAVVITAACGSSQQGDVGSGASEEANTAGGNQGEVNVYSSRHYDSDDAIYQRFTEETGIEVNLIEGDADELTERIKNEGANSPADVLVTVDAGRLWRAEQDGLFQPVESTALTQAIPENLRHPEGLWFGLTQRARVLVYNKEAVEPSELSTYEALAEPQWQDRVCVRSSGNIYNQSLLGSMIESDGAAETEDWVEGLVANLAREPEGGDIDQIKAVAAGQCDVAIVNHYYWARLAKSSDPDEQAVTEATGVFFPNQEDRGTHVNISGAGVVANAPNRENAIAFLEFLVTPEAQEIFANSNNEYPVLQGVEIDPVVSELGNFKVDETNVSAYGRNNSEVVKIVDRTGWK